MAITIAFSGKGGVGKTTLAALSARYFLDKKLTPVLAVDSDPNSNLNIALGMQIGETIADVREEVLDKKVPQGIPKTDFISQRMDEILIESDEIDLLVMGRPEGQGCYCAVNHLLRDYLKRLSKHYKAIVIDSEAGMEHLSRRTTDDLDVLFIVANPDAVSIQAASRIEEIAQKLKLKIKNIYLILNRTNENMPDFIKETIRKEKLDLIGFIPQDSQLKTALEEGKTIISISDTSAYRALEQILNKLR